MSPSRDQLTAAEISRLAGVTRATVSNWRRRHEDFPRPSGGTDSSPTYDRVQVETWLAARGRLPARSAADLLAGEARQVADPLVLHRLFPAVIALGRMTPDAIESLARLSDTELATQMSSEVQDFARLIPTLTNAPAYGPPELPLLRALVACVQDAGALAAIEVISTCLTPDIAVRGTYYTPPQVIQLMIDLVGDVPANRVMDPACGTGGLLAAAATSLRTGELYGQDIAAEQAAAAAARLGVLAPDATTEIHIGNTLLSDAFTGLAADIVLCNPPYADKSWGHDELTYDPRWTFGVPPKTESELAWIQHCLAHLRPGGTAVVLVPPGVAERPPGRRIRAELTRAGAVRAVMALTPGAAPPFNIGLHLWVLRRPESDRPSTVPVLFVDASGVDSWDAVRDTILNSWHSFTTAPRLFKPISGAARAVPVLDLMRAEMDLTPTRHVRTVAAVATPDDFAASVKTRRAELHQATAALHAMDDADWPPTGARPFTWRTVTIGDLLRGNALEMHRTAPAPRSTEDETGGPQAAVMTARDVTTGGGPSTSQIGRDPKSPPPALQVGDVLLPELLRGAIRARVVGPDDAGSLLGPHVLLFRPDPDRLDPWFLAGFLAAEENVHGATTGSSIVRIQPRRLRVPLMPLEKQREYGSAFERLHALRRAAEIAHRLAEDTVRDVNLGLTAGVLLPPSA